MCEKFQQMMMQAFYQRAKAIHICGNGIVIFEVGKRFKYKKMEKNYICTQTEVEKLIVYIKNMTNAKSYTIEPTVHLLYVGTYCLQVQICCIPSMYFECIVLRIIKSKTIKMKKQYLKNKYIV